MAILSALLDSETSTLEEIDWSYNILSHSEISIQETFDLLIEVIKRQPNLLRLYLVNCGWKSNECVPLEAGK